MYQAQSDVKKMPVDSFAVVSQIIEELVLNEGADYLYRNQELAEWLIEAGFCHELIEFLLRAVELGLTSADDGLSEACAKENTGILRLTEGQEPLEPQKPTHDVHEFFDVKMI